MACVCFGIIILGDNVEEMCTEYNSRDYSFFLPQYKKLEPIWNE